MKIIAFLSLISLIAGAETPQDQAARLAAPAMKSAYKNDEAARQLDELERQESGAEPVARPATNAAEAVAKPRVTDFVSQVTTTRYLFLKVSDSLLRFHVDANLGDDELETVVRALGTSCLKRATGDATCDPLKQNSIVYDSAFFADAKLSQAAHWSKEKTPKGQIWKLVCASGGDDCFDRLAKVRAFKLTTNRKVLETRILAHGFESQAVRASSKKFRAPASVNAQRTFDRVYLMRTTSEKIPHLPKGTL